MLSLRDFWRRHRRKAFVSLGVLGSAYVLYKLYVSHRQRLIELERELAGQQETDELIKAQQQAHFENIQRIADSTTLPYAMHYLQSRLSEELDLSHLTERLMQGKGEPNTLTSSEKLELWEKLKILSFTRMVSSLWTMTSLSLYIRVQVNILGRHLYIDIARDHGSSHLFDEGDPLDQNGQKEFLATADYLANQGILSLIPNMQTAVTEALKGISVSPMLKSATAVLSRHQGDDWVIGLLNRKHLRDHFNMSMLCESIVQILDTFMSIEGPHHWVSYLLPENAISYKHLTAASSNVDNATPISDISKLEQLMMETRSVLSSVEFQNLMEICLRSVVETLTDEFGAQSSSSLSKGVPLAKLLPQVAQMGPLLLEHPTNNRFLQTIASLKEVELFYTLLYANMSLVA